MKRHPIATQYRSHHPHPCDGHLPPDLGAALQQRVTEAAAAMVEVNKGETLAHSGMPFKHLHLVVSGAFKSVQLGEDGRTQIVCFYGRRELMGLSGFAQHVHTTDLVALAPSLICEFPVAAVQSIIDADGMLRDRLLAYVSESLAQAEQDQFMLGSMSATQKIAFFLLRAQDKRRRNAEDPQRFELPMTREEIGSYLGLTMETVSRLFSQLQTQGVVRVDKRLVQILRDDLLQVWRSGGVEFSAPVRKKRPDLKFA